VRNEHACWGVLHHCTHDIGRGAALATLLFNRIVHLQHSASWFMCMPADITDLCVQPVVSPRAKVIVMIAIQC
jgi:hypothetical protein